MKKPSSLRLFAEDNEGLEVISSMTQDGLAKMTGLSYQPKVRRFAIEMNRFNWEILSSKKRYFRTLSMLAIDSVLKVRSRNIPSKSSSQIISLLAISFTKKNEEQPDGVIHLSFSNNIEMELEVECLDVSLIDSDSSWPTLKKPKHKDPKKA